MGKAEKFGAVVSVLVVIPIWFYLIYKLLEATNATELTWFLFWIYVPGLILTRVLATIATKP